MASHLEVRVPFLDHRVVELGVGLREQFTRGVGGKRVLRAIHQRRFGAALANRRKQDYGPSVLRELVARRPAPRGAVAG